MPTELEQRLTRLLSGPEPDADAERRALRRALGSLPRAVAGQRRLRIFAASAAAATFVLLVAAGGLAAAGALHLSLGRETGRPGAPGARPTVQLGLPRGAAGIAAVIDGRLWLTTPKLRLEGLPVSAAALSPHALYVAAGIGTSLVAMAPGGTRAWSHPAGGRVVRIAWAPDGLRVAYVVQRGRRLELRTIEGDGDHDRLLDPSVRPATPSWRADSLAVAYVGAGGRPVVYDFDHASHRTLPGSTGVVRSVLFAPRGNLLALVDRAGLRFARGGRVSPVARDSGVAAVAWLDDVIAVAGGPDGVRLYRPGATGAPLAAGRLAAPGRVAAADATRRDVVLAVEPPTGQVRVLTRAPTSDSRPQVLLELPRGARIATLSVR